MQRETENGQVKDDDTKQRIGLLKKITSFSRLVDYCSETDECGSGVVRQIVA